MRLEQINLTKDYETFRWFQGRVTEGGEGCKGAYV